MGIVRYGISGLGNIDSGHAKYFIANKIENRDIY